MYQFYIFTTFVIASIMYIRRFNNVYWIPPRFFILSLSACLICIVTFRPDTAIDVSEYITSIEIHSARMEPSFSFIVTLTDGISNQCVLIFFIYALISIVLRIVGLIRYSESFLASLLIYLSNIYILHDNIQIRAAVASALLPFIIDTSVKRKIYFFIPLIVLAVLFHYSAGIFALIWFIKGNSLNKKLYCWLIPISYLLCILGLRFGYIVSYVKYFSELILFFQTKGDDVNIYNALQLIHVFICLYLWKYAPILKQHSEYLVVCLKIYTIAVVLLPLFSDIPTLAFRLNEFGISVESILLASGIYAIYGATRTASLYILIYSTVIFLFSYFTYIDI